MRYIARDMNRAGGVSHQIDARRIAAAFADLVVDPSNRAGDILRARRPGRLRREAIGDIDADETVLRRPQHDVVIERTGRSRSLVAAHERAAMDEDQHRPGRSGRRLRHENIEQVAVGGAVFDIPLDPDALIRLLLLQRRIERQGVRRVDDPAHLHQSGGDLRRHRALLRQGRACDKGRARDHKLRLRSRLRQRPRQVSVAPSRNLPVRVCFAQHGRSETQFIPISP